MPNKEEYLKSGQTVPYGMLNKHIFALIGRSEVLLERKGLIGQASKMSGERPHVLGCKGLGYETPNFQTEWPDDYLRQGQTEYFGHEASLLMHWPSKGCSEETLAYVGIRQVRAGSTPSGHPQVESLAETTFRVSRELTPGGLARIDFTGMEEIRRTGTKTETVHLLPQKAYIMSLMHGVGFLDEAMEQLYTWADNYRPT